MYLKTGLKIDQIWISKNGPKTRIKMKQIKTKNGFKIDLKQSKIDQEYSKNRLKMDLTLTKRGTKIGSKMGLNGSRIDQKRI